VLAEQPEGEGVKVPDVDLASHLRRRRGGARRLHQFVRGSAAECHQQQAFGSCPLLQQPCQAGHEGPGLARACPRDDQKGPPVVFDGPALLVVQSFRPQGDSRGGRGVAHAPIITLVYEQMFVHCQRGQGGGRVRRRDLPTWHAVTRRLILASSSPARLQLLQGAGLQPEVVPSHVAEDGVEHLPPTEAVRVLAQRKAEVVAASARIDSDPPLVIGCDSLLEFDGAAWGKPDSPAEVGRPLAKDERP
jgi:hypothetical protein